MPAAGTDAVPFRRCCACGQLYQKLAAHAAKPVEEAPWRSLQCAGCASTVWYPARGGGTCVCCWACQHLNPINGAISQVPGGRDAPEAAPRSKRSVVSRLLPSRGRRAAPSEGLCRKCTLGMAGITTADLCAARAPAVSPVAAPNQSGRSPARASSPTSLTACLHALVVTEVVAREGCAAELWRALASDIHGLVSEVALPDSDPRLPLYDILGETAAAEVARFLSSGERELVACAVGSAGCTPRSAGEPGGGAEASAAALAETGESLPPLRPGVRHKDPAGHSPLQLGPQPLPPEYGLSPQQPPGGSPGAAPSSARAPSCTSDKG
eukprot:TRINITY_DN24069_c0_g1_i1.p1 TRINITY_DN24069_c0_g1~~TRINITY_DN24069_c0_g1_i1.p1  ORF type:complete len:347 (+),score=72.02 TRINITY_DN24069_c0_g1_i1:68-1042(+)